MDFKTISETYERMLDEDILRIALYDAKGLRPDIITVLQDQIKKRNLNPDLINGIIAQRKRHTIEELVRYSELIQGLRCPICDETGIKLNGTITHTIKSIIFLSFRQEALVIACPKCLDNKNKEANFENVIFGWWSGHGIFLTPVYISRNRKEKKSNHLKYPNKTLIKFALSSIGYIETYKNDPEKLLEIIG